MRIRTVAETVTAAAAAAAETVTAAAGTVTATVMTVGAIVIGDATTGIVAGATRIAVSLVLELVSQSWHIQSVHAQIKNVLGLICTWNYD